MNERFEILVVDDDEVDRIAVCRALRAAGLEALVVEAADAPEALERLSARPFDCVLLDLRLPRADGLTLLHAIREERVDTPVVMLTGQGDEQTAVAIMKAGASDYIPKAALTPERLAQSLRQAVRVRRAEREAAKAQRALERHAQRLRGLSEAALAINAASTVEEVLREATDRARVILDARCAEAVLCSYRRRTGALSATSHASEESAPLRHDEVALPERSAQIVGRSGASIGRIVVWGAREDAFDEQDDHILAQLAQMTSIAVENKALFELVEEERQRAEEASRAKDEFLAIVSHELRTPLNAILGWARMLQTEEVGPERRARAIAALERNARAQAQIIEDLLDVSRIISGKLRIDVRPMDLRRVIDAAVDVVRPMAEAKGVVLTADIEAGVGALRGDPDRLQQVVWNLLVNAIKFTPREGVVALRAAARGEDVMVEVRDTGEGIEPHFLPHLFERFRQADSSTTRVHGGLGLGLSIVKHIVDLHGGAVYAQSPGKGRGATFTLTLPSRGVCEAPPTPSDPGTPPAHDEGALEGLEVLLVDDDIDSREILLEIFERHGARVRAVASATAALAALAESPDVLVSDIGMPGEDGYELIRKIRARGAELPAIALTAYAGLEDRRRARDAGFQAHLGKPVDPTDLIATIARLSGRSARGSS